MSEQNADQTGSVGAAAATVVEQQRQQLQPSASSHRPSRILFGSCSSQSYSEQPLWSAILARNATAWVWGGDAIYAGMWCVAQRERKSNISILTVRIFSYNSMMVNGMACHADR
jgi:hypothetical protein